jgi:hypothetical protein
MIGQPDIMLFTACIKLEEVQLGVRLSKRYRSRLIDA